MKFGFRFAPVALFLPLIALCQQRPLITARIDENRLHTLKSNTRPEANAQNDLGAVAETLTLDHMMLQLKRSSEQETALQQFIDQAHNSKSASFHKWMTPAQFGAAFGAAQQDIDTITSWLRSHNFVVNAVYPSGMLIDFSGTAGQVRTAFHTEIHNLDVNGQHHVANMSDPQIPEALTPAIAGIVSLHDFTPRPQRKARPQYTFTYQGSTQQAVTPEDLATIYNLTPLFNQGLTGKGQTVAVIEDATLYDTADWQTFRSTFNLAQYSNGSLTIVQPAATGGTNCTAPGLASGDDGEAILDAEWASAAAPDAAIQVAACASTRSTFGGLIALQNLVNGANPPSIVSISYGECEAGNGAALNAAFGSLYQQAVAEGISVFVSAGDEGAASCDAGATGATHGIGVSGWASTPYNVAVGGTDFGDAYAGTQSTYWNSTNDAAFGSAISYIPEIPWNDSCASTLLAASMDFSTAYGANGLCASSQARQYDLLQVAAGSGGPSGCATGSPSTSGVVSGTCKGYAKPSWQSGLTGIPQDGVRDLPDVSMFSGSGVWGHFLVFCWSDLRNGGAPCTGDPSNWAGGGGTSFAAPVVAGIQALVNQKTGSAQGNPNYVYYQLAATNTCNSSDGDSASSTCVFHNVTQGDIAVNCGGTESCFGADTTTSTGFGGGRRSTRVADGALSVSTQSYTPAYGTASGWNFANGIGSLNALNLVNNWTSVQ